MSKITQKSSFQYPTSSVLKDNASEIYLYISKIWVSPGAYKSYLFLIMKLVKNMTYDEIYSLVGSEVRFISDCEIFPNFDVIGKVKSISLEGPEYIFIVSIKGKNIYIGSNMKNLKVMKTVQ